MTGERTFVSTGPRGLDLDLPPMRLFQRAKRLGVWDPRDLDLTHDREDWLELAEEERDALLRLSALFGAGEESVTLDLLPLIAAIAEDGRLEEEMYLSSFLFEEAKHVELFSRFFTEVAHAEGDLSRYHSPSWRTIFCAELPEALGRLRSDRSPSALAEASVTYNIIVEGVLAETGYHGYRRILEQRGVLAGMRAGIGLVQRDESRHLAYGVWLLSRLLAEHGEVVWEAIERRMAALLTPALGVIDELFAAYDPMPFGLVLDDFAGFAIGQFRRRMARIEAARGAGPAALALEE